MNVSPISETQTHIKSHHVFIRVKEDMKESKGVGEEGYYINEKT